MTIEETNKLVSEGEFPKNGHLPELVETHISWVIICDCFVYKIKKPIHYSFLNLSTLERRKYLCEREVELNKRLTEYIYLDVQPVANISDRFVIGRSNSEVIDYAV